MLPDTPVLSEQNQFQTPNVSILVEALPVVNYALQQNRLPMVRSLVLVNEGEEPIREAELSIVAEPAFCAPVTKTIDLIPAKSRFETIKDIEIKLDGKELACLTEKVAGTLTFELSKGNEILALTTLDVSVLAFDEWPGQSVYPELIAAFSNPNHPVIVGVLSRAASLLEKWTGDPSIVGYQFKDPDRVLQQAAAIYVALQQQNIVYSILPASFEKLGQRIRLSDAVLEQKMGNCIELTLLYAACLEACALHPLVIFKPGHAFLGLWLEEMTFQETVQYDASLLTKRLADGVNEIAVIESTCMTGGKNVSFDEACRAGERHLGGETAVNLIVDIRRARLSGITPLPQRIATENGWEILPEKRPEKQGGAAPESYKTKLDVEEGVDPEAASKMAQWERKLLDLGLRNALINLRMSKTMVPILTSSLDDLEDALASGRDFYVSYRPAEWTVAADKVDFETLSDLSEIAPLLRSEFNNRRLRSALGEKELNRTIKELYRAAKASLEENGANTLYLAMGLLRWYEERSSQPRYAPLVLVPVEIVRQSANMGYLLRLRDDEPQMNITMLEKLKQDFGIVVSGLDPLPTDQHGIDIR
ncbi:MAG: DUF4011 domain-containing protein [Oscillospiraceae bacterium]|nr:DUF4011 domain-containing protein [Oscillospiraceae bacterium]